MGQKLDCILRYRRRTLAGKAYLETAYVLFRGEERLKIPFESLTGVHAAGGVLKLEFAEGPALFQLGAAAEKWARKILHPPTRLEKLGVKPGLAIAVEGEFDAEFLREIGQVAGVEVVAARAQADLLFFAAQKTADLTRLSKLKARLKPRGALWVVYPKGVAAIRELEVIEAGRAAGLKDNKVASFSSTHTALRFASSGLPVR
jgi:hypothetical protein